MPQVEKLLIIRFSSFGDIVQCMGVPEAFKRYPSSIDLQQRQVHWLVRSDFAGLLSAHPHIDQIIKFDRAEGVLGLWRLSDTLARASYSHIYDAHNNLRSKLLHIFLAIRGGSSPNHIRRPKHRLKRWLLFRKRLALLPTPFKGIESFHEPLRQWRLKFPATALPQFFVETAAESKVELLVEQVIEIALVPSAAWEMKRWPTQHWCDLIKLMPGYTFTVLGGPEDKFCEELKATAPERVQNFAGRLTLQESAAVIKRSSLVIANDTGLLHVADQLGIPTLALIGPTAFGYPAHATSLALEIDLPCKPCSKDGRGKCINPVYQLCLKEISPQAVASAARAQLANRAANG